MSGQGYLEAIREQTSRALWEVENTVDCIPDDMWDTPYCGMPLYKHVYHMLHSLDQWFINPHRYVEPPFHIPNLNNLDAVTDKVLSREELRTYFLQVRKKIKRYLDGLTEDVLLAQPEGCEWTRFTLMLTQHRHLHSHIGMLMGFIIAKTGLWPKVIGLTGKMTEREGRNICKNIGLQTPAYGFAGECFSCFHYAGKYLLRAKWQNSSSTPSVSLKKKA